MKRKLLSLMFAVFATTYFCSAQVLFDPADYSVGDSVAPGMSIVDMGGTQYLQVVLNGWSSNLAIPTIKLAEGLTATCQFKFAIGDTSIATGILLSQINTGINLHDTVNKVPNPYGAGLVPSSSVLSQSPATGAMVTLTTAMNQNSKLIQNIQFWGQRTIAPNQWGATSYDTIWVGKIVLTGVITRETFGTTQFGTDANSNGKLRTTGDTLTGWKDATRCTWRWDDAEVLESFTSKNGRIEGGGDSSLRVVNGGSGFTLPADYRLPASTSGVQLLLTNRMPNYAGSWDTTEYTGINIHGYTVTGVEFGYAKNTNLFINEDTNAVNAEYRIDGGPWVQLDTSLIPSFANGVWKYIKLPVDNEEGEVADIRVIGLNSTQIFIDDLTLVGSITTGTDSVKVSAVADTIKSDKGTVQLSAVVYPAGASQTVSWSVDGMNASINEDGLLTAYSNGDVVVTATAVDGTEGTYTIILQGQVPTAMPIANNIVGKFDGPSDYNGTVAIGWEADSVYMNFVVTDDSIVNGADGAGNNYQVDNIEIYFDIDNSKNIHLPRNGGWVSGDMTFDDNDYQLRLVLGVNGIFDATNAQFPAKVMHELNDTGYTYTVRVAWDDLLDGFTPTTGDTIGFDVLLSDQDSVASDAGRNQFTWVSPTDKAFNDPSLWGSLVFVEGGLFDQLPIDNIAPSKPTISGTAGILSDTLRWTASTDNSAILYYEINVSSTESTKIIYYPTALSANYTYVHKNLEVQEYTYYIIAYDNFGNKSATSNPIVLTPLDGGVKIDVVNTSNFAVYPNPVVNELNIKNASSIVKVEVLGINGNIITTSVYSNEQMITVNTSQLASGMYFVRMTTAEGQVVMNKIVKK